MSTSHAKQTAASGTNWTGHQTTTEDRTSSLINLISSFTRAHGTPTVGPPWVAGSRPTGLEPVGLGCAFWTWICKYMNEHPSHNLQVPRPISLETYRVSVFLENFIRTSTKPSFTASYQNFNADMDGCAWSAGESSHASMTATSSLAFGDDMSMQVPDALRCTDFKRFPWGVPPKYKNWDIVD